MIVVLSLADFDLLAGILHPEVEFQTNWPGLAPAVYGVEGVRRFAEGFLEPWEWLQLDVREVVEVDGETVFVAAHVRAAARAAAWTSKWISTTCSPSATEDSCCDAHGPIGLQPSRRWGPTTRPSNSDRSQGFRFEAEAGTPVDRDLTLAWDETREAAAQVAPAQERT